MFGKRFSISASTLAVAGACSVMFSPSVTMAQSYQPTHFRGYSRPQLSGLSGAATRPPAFSDTAAEATAMSPNNWGESAISNPRAGYNNTQRVVSNNFLPAAVPTYATQQAPVNQKSLSAGGISPKPEGPAADSLTNTTYERTAMLPSVFSNAAYSKDKSPRLAEKPKVPALEISAHSTARSSQAKLASPLLNNSSATATAETILETDPLNLSAPYNGVQSLAAQSKVDSLLKFESLPKVESLPLPKVDRLPTKQSVYQQPPVQQFQNQHALQHQPQFASSQPIATQYGYPLFTPSEDQPTYFQPATHNAPQPNGQGYGYLESGQIQSYVETPSNIYNSGFGIPTYRSNVGHRSGFPTARNQTIFDQGESFDHENKKKEFPPFSEIIAQGRFFGSVGVAYLRPHFLGNTAISIDGPTFSESIPFEFDNETAPYVRVGFESKYGPGFEMDYFTLNANSNAISQGFDGISPVTTIASIAGPNRFTQLSADAVGESLNANHSFEIETFGFNVFKDIEFKVSRIGGRFGFTYANIAQSLEASVTDVGDNILDSLSSTSDFRGFGPKLGIDYYRPMGHTPLEFVTSFTGMGLFGRRDQFVNNSAGVVERRFGADEFVAMLDLTSGIQYKKTVAENRAWYARLSFAHQTWLGGGTAVDPTGDFGMKGIIFAVGYNR